MSDRAAHRDSESKSKKKRSSDEEEYESNPEADLSSHEEHSSNTPAKKKKSKEEKASKRSKSEKKSKHRHREKGESEPEGTVRRDSHGSDGSEAEETIGDEEEIERRETSKKKSNVETEAKLDLLLEKMERAYEADRQDMADGKPAISKLKTLPELDVATLQETSREFMLEKNIFSIFTKWLRPYSDNTLPNLTIRTSLIDIIGRFQLDYDHLEEYVKPSQLGKVLTKLQSSPQETAENKRKIEVITDKWKRILNPAASSVGKKDKGSDRRLSAERGPQRFSDICKEIDEKRKQPMKPGDPGFRMGVRVPVAIDLRNIRPPSSAVLNDGNDND